MERVVVFTDPTNHPDYVHQYVRTFFDHWGIRSVLVFPRSVSRLLMAEANAVIGKVGIAARYTGDLSDLAGLATMIRSHFRVVAAVPQAEYQVLPVSRLADLLDIDWVPLSTMSLFRDKYSLKRALRQAPNAPRMNHSIRVATAAEALAFVRDREIARFVLKPNDGGGNSRIAFFDSDAPAGEVESYFATNIGTDVLLEEFIEGDEYCVNGQVDEFGIVRTYSVQRSVYIAANGRTNLGGGYRVVHHATPEFEVAACYAQHVLSEAGLMKSPFHMEIKIGPYGPCMIEVGARLGGAGIPRDTSLAHGGAVDLFAEAARCYANLPGGAAEPDWGVYDNHVVWTVLGVAPRDERVINLQGMAEVQSRPEFAYWVMPPQLGQRVRRTVDLGTSPWQVTLEGRTQDQLRTAEDEVRHAISWNRPVGRPVRLAEEARATAAWAIRRLPLLPALLTAHPRRMA